jgi:hypothetical protein
VALPCMFAHTPMQWLCLGGCRGLPWWVFWHALVGVLACLGGCFGMPWRVPWPALVRGMACLGGCNGMPWCVPWHAKTSWCRTNFFLARAICPKCVSKFIIRHLEGVPSIKSKVGSGALVGAMACLGVCHGMPKRVGAAQIFFWPVPFAQSVFLSSL